MMTVVLSVPGADCGVCRHEILRTLLAVPGVQDATVDLRAKQARVLLTPAAVQVGALCARLRQAGYPAVLIASGDGDPTTTQERLKPST